MIPNHKWGALLTSIFCFQIGGLIALMYAGQVDARLAAGDLEGALKASQSAARWIRFNILVFVVLCVGGILWVSCFAGQAA